MSNDYFKAQGWFKNYALNSQDSRGVFQQLVKEDEEEAARLASAESDKIKDMINEKFGPGTMKPASELPPIQNPFEDFEERNPAAEGGRMRFSEGLDAKKMPKIELDRINNPSKEALDEISSIIDKYTKTSNVAGKEIKHLSKDGPVDQIFKEIKTKGYKKPSISKVLFKQVLESKGITTYDNYRTNKIVFTLQDVLRKNDGNILSIKPSAVAEILPEFAIEGKKGGKGLPIFRTFLNYLEGSERLIDRSGLEKPGQIAGKPVNQIIDEMKQNFLDSGEGRARGNFTVFEETKLLEKLGLENPDVTANELKKLYEKAGGNSFRERVNSLYLAKTGQVTNKTDGGKSIIDAVRSGEITNKFPDSLRNSFNTYARDYNFARMTRFAGEATNVDLINEYTKTANIFTKNNLEKMGVPKGLVAEHGLPISAYDRGVADESTRLKIDGFVTKQVNDWKAKNFDFPVFRPGGLADKYKNASEADKPKIQAQIEEKLKLVKSRTPELVRNITFDFTDGKFTASSSTPVISNDVIPNLIKRGDTVNQVFYITDTTGKVKQPMFSSGFAGAYEMLSDDLKKIVNSEGFKKFANSKTAKGLSTVAKAPGKFFGLGDILLGYLDYTNNKPMMSEAKAYQNMLQAMSFGIYRGGDEQNLKEIKEKFIANGGDGNIFDQVVTLNRQNADILQTVENTKKNYKKNLENEKAFGNIIGNVGLKYQVDLPTASEQLKLDLNSLKSKAENMDKNFDIYKETYTGEDLTKPSKDLKRAAFDLLEEEQIKNYPSTYDQVNTGRGPVAEQIYNSILTKDSYKKLLPQNIPSTINQLLGLNFKPVTEKEKEAALIQEMKKNAPQELYRYNKEFRNMDPDNPITMDETAKFMQKNKKAIGFSEGGITQLRSKYEYKK
jgi:hypothetical protein